jgi:hypothetical protein
MHLHPTAVLACLTWLASPLLAGTAEASSQHKVTVDVVGPLALVEVERPLLFEAEAGREASDEAVVDLDLPEGARLAGAEVRGGGRVLALVPAAGPRTYEQALATRGWRRSQAAVDEGTDLRVAVAAAGLGEKDRAAAWTLRYRYVVALGCRDGRFVLALPAALDPSPTPAAVTVRLELGAGAPRLAELLIGGATVRASGHPAVARAVVSGRMPWEVAFALRPAPARAGGLPAAALAAWGSAPGKGKAGWLALGLCRPPAAPRKPPPERLWLLIDRSRSMGLPGAAASRDLARALVEALPPSARFNAVLFDRSVEPLFPVPRAATLEALAAIDEAVGPGSLKNGSDLPAALRRAVALARAEGGEAPAAWVLISDGALADEHTAGVLASAVAPLDAARSDMAVLVLRPEEDEPAPLPARQALAALPGRLGGVLRELGVSRAAAAAPAIVAALRAGGDLLEPRVVSGGGDWRFSAPAVPAGEGAALLVSVPAAALTSEVRGRHDGAAVAATVHAARIPAGWLGGLGASPPVAWVRVAPGAAAAVARPALGEPEAVARGQMDRLVVRNALSLAFLPRARACYLTRPVKEARDFALRGKLRLELLLDRGEVLAATVKSSTLGRPEIEACLREAAFALEVPRALHSDAPVIAALNLLFQPPAAAAKPVSGSTGDGGAPVSEEIDLILGPMTKSDPLELLRE